ncbi:MAG: ribosome assembly RNA-binding protein YhbY, partial [Thermoanaerobaculales bacterium]|nr:ribosome assembly RNA-binding protein YhbY [Thermoanaerobaculales bacterium]
MALTDPQRRHLRGLAHHLKPVVLMGQHGLKDTVLSEIDGALTHHELVKVRVAGEDRDERASTIEAIVAATGADLVQTIGHVAVLFRRNPKKPRV